MLLWIAIGGGLTLMMGQHARSKSLFYYFRLEDQVPEGHLLRMIDTHIDFSFVREQLKDSYSDTGRPSIDPEPTHSQDKVSTTDPDSTYATKGGTPARMGYYNNYLVDNHSCIIVGVQAMGARLSEESRAAEEIIARFSQWQGTNPQSIAADASYGNGELLQWLMDRQITPYMPTRDAVARTRSPLFGPERFTYQPESNSYLCPAGQQLNYGGRNDRNRAFAYIGTRPKCGPCPLKSQCTRGAFRFLAIHMNEAARQRARDLWNTPEFAQAQRQRKKVEALFAELKGRIGLHRLRLRRLKFVQEQFFMAAMAQNIKRLVRFLSTPTAGPATVTA